MAQSIGEKIREVRLSKGLSQRWLAKRTGICRESLRRIEMGLLEPEYQTVVWLCEALGLKGICELESCE